MEVQKQGNRVEQGRDRSRGGAERGRWRGELGIGGGIASHFWRPAA